MQTRQLPPILQTAPGPKFLIFDYLTRCKKSSQVRRVAKHPEISRELRSLFPVQHPDLLDEIIDFFRRQFARIFGHTAFATSYDVAQVVYRRRSPFVGDQRWSAKVPPLGSLSVALRALFLIQRVLNQFGAGRRSLRQRCANHEVHSTRCNRQRICLHVAPHRNNPANNCRWSVASSGCYWRMTTRMPRRQLSVKPTRTTSICGDKASSKIPVTG